MFWFSVFVVGCVVLGVFLGKGAKGTSGFDEAAPDVGFHEMDSGEIDPDVTVSGLYPSSDDD